LDLSLEAVNQLPVGGDQRLLSVGFGDNGLRRGEAI